MVTWYLVGLVTEAGPGTTGFEGQSTAARWTMLHKTTAMPGTLPGHHLLYAAESGGTQDQGATTPVPEGTHFHKAWM